MLRDLFKQYDPWVSKFNINGEECTNGTFDVLNDGRIHDFLNNCPGVRTILELSCLEGGHTALLAQYPGIEHVLAVESREENIRRAEFLHRKVLGIFNSLFIKTDVEGLLLGCLKKFDAILCTGLLYHLSNPLKLLRQFKDISDNVYLGTHYSTQFNKTEMGIGHWYDEQGVADVLSGMKLRSFWLNLDYLKDIITSEGYEIVKISTTETNHGPWANILMQR